MKLMLLSTAAKQLGLSKPATISLLRKAGRERAEHREISYVYAADVAELIERRKAERINRQTKPHIRKIKTTEIDPVTFELVEVAPQTGTRRCPKCGALITVGKYKCAGDDWQFQLGRANMGDTETYGVF